MISKGILQYVMHIAYLLLFVYKSYINIEKVNRGYSMVQDVEYGIYITSETGFFFIFSREQSTNENMKKIFLTSEINSIFNVICLLHFLWILNTFLQILDTACITRRDVTIAGYLYHFDIFTV